jgi:glycerophosphoryl diester phosphodiesterase
MTFTLIAHRGYSDLAPENTLPAFDLAIERGFPHIELDLQLTRDGVPVVMHDDNVDRTTSGKGPLRAYTLDEIRALSAGSWFTATDAGRAGDFTTARVPTFEEVLERYAGRAHLHVELKSEEQDLADRIAPLFARYGWDGTAAQRRAWFHRHLVPH